MASKAVTSSSCVPSSSSSLESGSLYLAGGDEVRLRLRGLAGAESWVRWRGRAGTLKPEESDSGPEEASRDTGVGLRIVKETLDMVNHKVAFESNTNTRCRTARSHRSLPMSSIFLSALRQGHRHIRAPLRTVPISPRMRSLTTSWPRRAALASHPPAQPTVLLFSPSPEYIEEEEIDVDLLPPQEAQIVITDRAAEVRATVHTPLTLNSNSS